MMHWKMKKLEEYGMDYEITHRKKAVKPRVCSKCGKKLEDSVEYYHIERKEEYDFRNIILCTGCYAEHKKSSLPRE